MGEDFVGVPGTGGHYQAWVSCSKGSDEGSFGALLSLLEPPVSISYHPVDISSR